MEQGLEASIVQQCDLHGFTDGQAVGEAFGNPGLDERIGVRVVSTLDARTLGDVVGHPAEVRVGIDRRAAGRQQQPADRQPAA